MEMRTLGIAGAEHAAPQEDPPVRKPFGPLRMEGQFALLGHGLAAESLAAVEVIAQAFLGEGLAPLREHRLAHQDAHAIGHPARLDDAVAREIVHLRRRELDARGLHLGVAMQGHLFIPDVKQDAVRRGVDDGILGVRPQGIRRRSPRREGQGLCARVPGPDNAEESGRLRRESRQMRGIRRSIEGMVLQRSEVREPASRGGEQGN